MVKGLSNNVSIGTLPHEKSALPTNGAEQSSSTRTRKSHYVLLPRHHLDVPILAWLARPREVRRAPNEPFTEMTETMAVVLGPATATSTTATTTMQPP